MKEQQTGKRIVSKGEYLDNIGKKVKTAAGGLILLFFCLGGLLITGQILFDFFQQPSWIGFFILLGNLSLLGGISLFFGYAGQLAIKEAKQTDPGVPLTRANTADLPAPDTLVRASAEPMQEQQLRHEVASTIVWPRMKR